MLVDVVQTEEYIKGGWTQDYKGYKVISAVSVNDMEKYSGRLKSGGVYIHCISNAPAISLDICLNEISGRNFPHLGITAQRGLAYCYRLLGEAQWYNFDCALGRDSSWKLDMKLHICISKSKKYELMIYLPSLCYVSGLNLNCGEGYTINPVPQAKTKYLFIGSSISFGIGVTSNAFMLGNIFTRKCRSDVTTVAFNCYNYFLFLNQFITDHIKEIKAADVIFLECDHKNFPQTTTVQNFPQILENLLQKTDSKIVLWNQPTLKGVTFAGSWIKRECIFAEIQKMRHIFPKRVALCDNNEAWSDFEFDMYAYSSNFINDNGFVWLQKKLNRILEEKMWSI